jgi:hypothetical protein
VLKSKKFGTLWYGWNFSQNGKRLPGKGWALNSAVECHLHTVEVIGSNPIAPTIFSIAYDRVIRLVIRERTLFQQSSRWPLLIPASNVVP